MTLTSNPCFDGASSQKPLGHFSSQRGEENEPFYTDILNLFWRNPLLFDSPPSSWVAVCWWLNVDLSSLQEQSNTNFTLVFVKWKPTLECWISALPAGTPETHDTDTQGLRVSEGSPENDEGSGVIHKRAQAESGMHQQDRQVAEYDWGLGGEHLTLGSPRGGGGELGMDVVGKGVSGYEYPTDADHALLCAQIYLATSMSYCVHPVLIHRRTVILHFKVLSGVRYHTYCSFQGENVLSRSSELIHSGDVVTMSRGTSHERVLFLFDHQLIYCKKVRQTTDNILNYFIYPRRIWEFYRT